MCRRGLAGGFLGRGADGKVSGEHLTWVPQVRPKFLINIIIWCALASSVLHRRFVSPPPPPSLGERLACRLTTYKIKPNLDRLFTPSASWSPVSINTLMTMLMADLTCPEM
ncbi:hypothetical protein E2C01_040861 [Portunus trituberculatus]|uniref:Uncharacterized protein n=1 Tax=Portunus trituberculatus TaxID=210409 RepID=A0A5B7FNU1_PORTR|nr:hypothetical protein [Portunus trituberculatus]